MNIKINESAKQHVDITERFGTFISNLPIIGKRHPVIASKNRDSLKNEGFDTLIARSHRLKQELDALVSTYHQVKQELDDFVGNLPGKSSEMDFHEASAIFFKHLEESNFVRTPEDEPDAHLSKLKNGIWYLRNRNGLVTRVGTVNKRVFEPNVFSKSLYRRLALKFGWTIPMEYIPTYYYP